MKLLLFFIFVLYSTPCLGQIPQDKLLHAGGCYAISATTSSIMYNITENKKKSLIYGISSAVIIGGINGCDLSYTTQLLRKHKNNNIKNLFIFIDKYILKEKNQLESYSNCNSS